jgi:hypothetical protein
MGQFILQLRVTGELFDLLVRAVLQQKQHAESRDDANPNQESPRRKAHIAVSFVVLIRFAWSI